MNDIKNMSQSELLALQEQISKLLVADAAPQTARRKNVAPIDLSIIETGKKKTLDELIDEEEAELAEQNISIDKETGEYVLNKLKDEFIYVYSRKKDFKVFERMTTVDNLVLDKLLNAMSYAGDEFGGQTVQLHSWQLEQMAEDLNINVRKIRDTIKKLKDGNVLTSAMLYTKKEGHKEVKAVVQINPFLFGKGEVKNIIKLRSMFMNRAHRACEALNFYERGE